MSQVTRREFVVLSGAALSLAASRSALAASEFPRKDITFIIPYGPGGNFDNFARVIAPAMERYLPHKVNIVPLNVAAGGGGKGMSQLYRAKPDGYSIGIFNIPGAFILQQQQGARGFDLNKFTWLGSAGVGETYAIGVRSGSPLKSVADLQALSKTRPVKFTCTGPEGTAYSTIVISSRMLGIVPKIITGYKSSNDYIVAGIRGDGDAVIATVANLERFTAGKQMRIIATFEPHSSIPGAADATSLAKPELSQLTIERLVGAPPGLAPDIKAILMTALDKAVRDPQTVAWAKKANVPWGAYPLGHAEALVREQSAFFDKWKKYLGAS